MYILQRSTYTDTEILIWSFSKASGSWYVLVPVYVHDEKKRYVFINNDYIIAKMYIQLICLCFLEEVEMNNLVEYYPVISRSQPCKCG